MEHLSDDVRKVFRFISDDRKLDIYEYLILVIGREYNDLKLENLIGVNIGMDYLDKEFIRIRYSGFGYRHINSAMRDNWNYEKNGNISLKPKFLEYGKKISDIISANPFSFGDFKTYRGVNVTYFKKYGINNINELVKLEGQFLFDRGFVSTSISLENCYFKKDNELGIDYNVMITYLIPKEFDDGIFLDGDMTYSKNQKEYLINSYNMAKVVSVNINDDNTANIVAIMIPKKIYDEYYSNINGQNRIR